MAPFEALYGRSCRSLVGWFEVGESPLPGPDIIYKAIEKFHIIRDRLKSAYSRKKSYADKRSRDHEFEIGYHVCLMIYAMKWGEEIQEKGEAMSPVCWSLRGFTKNWEGCL